MNLFEQFRRIANFFFLVMMILALVRLVAARAVTVYRMVDSRMMYCGTA